MVKWILGGVVLGAFLFVSNAEAACSWSYRGSRHCCCSHSTAWKSYYRAYEPYYNCQYARLEEYRYNYMYPRYRYVSSFW